MRLWSSCSCSHCREEFCFDVAEKRPPSSLCHCGTIAARLISILTPVSSDTAREDRPFLRPSSRTDLEVCRESTWSRQARRLLQPASGRLVRSARLCAPRRSRRFAMRTMDHCALTSLGTIAFCLLMVWRTALFFSFFLCTWLHSRPSPRYFPALRPFAPVFRCHWETFDTLEAGTCAGSRAWNFSSSSFFSLATMSSRECRPLSKNFHSRETDSRGPDFSQKLVLHTSHYSMFPMFGTSFCDASWLSL